MPRRKATTELTAETSEVAPPPSKKAKKKKNTGAAAEEEEASAVPVPSSAKLRKEVADLINKLPLLITGIPPANEPRLVYGCSPKSSGAILQLRGATFKPRKKYLVLLHRFADLWARYLGALRLSIPFFAEFKTDAALEAWLEDGAYERELQLPELADKAELRIVRPFDEKRTCALSSLPEDSLSEWCESFVHTAVVRSAIQTETEGKRSLFFLPNYWSLKGVATARDVPSDFVGGQLVVRAGAITAMEPYRADTPGARYRIAPTVVVVLEQQSDPAPWYAADPPALAECGALAAEVDRQEVRSWVVGLKAPWLKSLLQKLIRDQPLALRSPRVNSQATLRSPVAIAGTLCALALTRGVLDSRHHRIVSGAEGLFKRLAVIPAEDAHVNVNDVNFLLACASIAKVDPQWRPSARLMERAIGIAVAASEERRAFVVDSTTEGKAVALTAQTAPGWSLAAALLESIGGMQGDLRMFRNFAAASVGGKPLPICSLEKAVARPEVMEFSHCVDQHCAPAIAYYVDAQLAEQYPSAKTVNPMGPLLQEIFTQVTGVNPRRGQRVREEDSFVQSVRVAQQRFMVGFELARGNLILKAAQVVLHPTSTFVVQRVLAEDWLAGAIGVVKLSHSPAICGTVKPSSAHEFVIFRKPSRDGGSGGANELAEPMEEDVKAQHRATMRQRLTEGVHWTGCAPPLPEWNGATIAIEPIENSEEDSEDFRYVVHLPHAKTYVPWEQINTVRRTFPCFLPEAEANWFTPYAGFAGVQLGAADALRTELQRMSMNALRRVRLHAGNAAAVITMPRLARDGSALRGFANLSDVAAFQFLLLVSRLFPAALEFQQTLLGELQFRTHDSTLMAHVMDFVRERVSRAESAASASASSSSAPLSQWAAVKDTMRVSGQLRIPFAHQAEGVANLWRRYNSGLRRHPIIRPTGSGKTFIPLQYAAEKIQRGVMQRYMLYTAPTEALEAIYQEMIAFGFTVRILDPAKASKMRKHPAMKAAIADSLEMLPFTLTLVEHDKLRNLLTAITPQQLAHCFFWNDEAHKTLNSTARTDAALSFFSGADESGMMSATLVTEASLTKLMPWLESEFPLTPRNCLVALSDLDARCLPPFVPEVRELVRVAFTEEERKAYNAAMPVGLGGANTAATHQTVHTGKLLTIAMMNRGVVQQVQQQLADAACTGVHVVADSQGEGAVLKEELLKHCAGELKAAQVIVLGREVPAINLTPTNRTEHPNVRVVITPKSACAGYNLTRFSVNVKRVFEGKSIIKELQMDGRINRPGQPARSVRYITVVDAAGLWARTLEHQKHTKDINTMLNDAIAAPLSEDP